MYHPRGGATASCEMFFLAESANKSRSSDEGSHDQNSLEREGYRKDRERDRERYTCSIHTNMLIQVTYTDVM